MRLAALFTLKIELRLKVLKISGARDAHARPTAREESSKPTAAYLGARAPAEAAPAHDAPASRLRVQWRHPGLPPAVAIDQGLRADARSQSKISRLERLWI